MPEKKNEKQLKSMESVWWVERQKNYGKSKGFVEKMSFEPVVDEKGSNGC